MVTRCSGDSEEELEEEEEEGELGLDGSAANSG
jgi:hypothetical protein